MRTYITGFYGGNIPSFSHKNAHFTPNASSENLFMHMRKQRCRSASVNHAADQHLFCYIDSTILFILYPKFQASSHLLWSNSWICVKPRRKPLRHFFLIMRLMLQCLPFSTNSIYFINKHNRGSVFFCHSEQFSH